MKPLHDKTHSYNVIIVCTQVKFWIICIHVVNNMQSPHDKPAGTMLSCYSSVPHYILYSLPRLFG